MTPERDKRSQKSNGVLKNLKSREGKYSPQKLKNVQRRKKTLLRAKNDVLKRKTKL